MKFPLVDKAKFITLTVIVGLTVGYAFADWKPPKSSPQTCDSNPASANYDPACVPPLNVSSDAQEKAGGLILNTGGASIGLQVPSGKVTVGVPAASADAVAKFDLGGQIRIRGGNPGAGKVLVSDANGLASWGAAANYTISEQVVTTGWNGANFITQIDLGDTQAKAAAVALRKLSNAPADCKMTLGVYANASAPAGYVFDDQDDYIHDDGFLVVPLVNGRFSVERVTNLGGTNFNQWNSANKRCLVRVTTLAKFY